MINIDFHIHITKTTKDSKDTSDFDISNLKKLIELNQLNAIAITDHNYFDNEQYDNIKQQLSKDEIKIFPGMEISIDKQYHALLIFDDQYNKYADKLNDLIEIIKKDESIDSKKLIDYLLDIDKKNYILIPHWDKNKNNWNIELLENFVNSKIEIKCLECTNVIKQNRVRSNEKLKKFVPVCFGDNKLFKNVNEKEEYGYRVTTLDIPKDDITFFKIKDAFQNNKIKIFGNKDEFIYWHKNNLDYYFNQGLNVILGKRGSGKTRTLDRIYWALNVKDESPYITYIKQFDIASNATKEKFNDSLKKEGEKIKNTLYGDNIDQVIKYISKINLECAIKKIDDDINIIFDNARKAQIEKYKILSSQEYVVNKNKFDKFIKYIVEIKKAELLKEIVNKYQDHLSLLLDEIEKKWFDSEVDIKLKEIVNKYLKKIQQSISTKFNISPMPNLAEKIVNYIKDSKIIEDNNSFFKALNEKSTTTNKGKKFKEIISISKFKTKDEMINCIGKSKVVTRETFKYYQDNDICKFIQVMMNDKNLNCDLIKKSLLNVNVKIKNEFGNDQLSGGERSYYILLHKLDNVNSRAEILLLDEIEQSFDNIFLWEEIVSKIKEMISNKITICIATHNSTIALLTNPNKIIYCNYDTNSGEYQTYYGSIDGDKEFKNVDSSKQSIGSFNTIIGILESGEEQYQAKKEKYEQLK